MGEPDRDAGPYPPDVADSVGDEEAGLPISEDSFENAAPVAIERVIRREAEEDEALPGAPPRLDEALASLPETNKRMIDELFRGRFVAVRRIKPERLK